MAKRMKELRDDEEEEEVVEEGKCICNTQRATKSGLKDWLSTSSSWRML